MPTRLALLLVLLAGSSPWAWAQAGRGCSVFNQCPRGYSCMPFRQVCHRDSGALASEACQAGYGCAAGLNCEAGSQVCRGPGREGEACHATRPCGSGLNCEAGSQVCRGPGREGEACHATRPCGSGLNCEAGTQICRGPGREGEACHATRPCGNGLNCEAGSQVCRGPGGVGDACHATRPCGGGLSCQPGVHQCYHVPRKAGEPCVLGHGCGDGLYCQSFVQKCVPRTVEYNSSSPCGALRVQAVAEDARRANLTMSFSAGSGGGAGAYLSYETGLVYGNQGQFGCFATVCAGNQSNVSLGDFANFGISTRYEDFAGFSAVVSQAVDTPFLKLGFQTSQTFAATAPRHPHEILKDRLTGTSSGLSFGVGLSPVTIGSALCYTALLDGPQPLNTFADIESLLRGWGQLGYAPENRPQRLGGPAGTATTAAPPPPPPVPAYAPPPPPPMPAYVPPPQSSATAEQVCHDLIQGRVAWARGGSTAWAEGNVTRLCRGTVDPPATVDCFQRGIAAHNDWSRAINECAGGSPPAARPAGLYDARHPNWAGAVTLREDGSFARDTGDGGTYTFDGTTLWLRWSQWGAEALTRQPDGSFVAASGFSLRLRAAPAPVAGALAGTYDALHPNWRGAVTLQADGSFARDTGDGGTWVFDGTNLQLRWTHWGAEVLTRQPDGSFRASGNGFTLRRR